MNNEDERYWREEYRRRIQFNNAVDHAIAAIAEFKEIFDDVPASLVHPWFLYEEMDKADLLHAIKLELNRETAVVSNLVESCGDVIDSPNRERNTGKLIAYQSMSAWLHNVEMDYIRVRV